MLSQNAIWDSEAALGERYTPSGDRGLGRGPPRRVRADPCRQSRSEMLVRTPHLGVASIDGCPSRGGGCGGFVLERWLVMTKLSRLVIACISATIMMLGVASLAGADSF